MIIHPYIVQTMSTCYNRVFSACQGYQLRRSNSTNDECGKLTVGLVIFIGISNVVFVSLEAST